MNTVFLIAVNTVRETVRNKVLYNILFFAIGIILLSISFGEAAIQVASSLPPHMASISDAANTISPAASSSGP